MVSIIIPVYNTAKYLHQALDSVINQTYSNLQIICINDGSTDNSLSILEKYASSDNRVQIITQKNAGLSAARNRGLSKVIGNYVMFLDSDDWLDLNTVEMARRQLIEKEVDIVLWGYKKEYSSKSIPVQVWNNEHMFTGATIKQLNVRLIGLLGAELKNPALLDSLGTAWGKLYKAHLFSVSNTKFTDTKIIGSAEDILFNIELFSYAKSAYFSNEIWHHYRKDNATSLTKTYKRELTTQWQNLFNRLQHLIERFHLGDSAYEALENRKALAIIGLGLNELEAEKSFTRQNIRIRALLATPWLSNALKRLPLNFFPIHWKLFFYLAKKNNNLLLSILLRVIKYILAR